MKRFLKITTTQLARICGVSQGTVDRALHNRDDINPKTRERILAVAKEYDYLPNVQCANSENSLLIGVVLFDLYNEFFSKLAMSLVRAAKLAGYSVIFQFSNKDKKSEISALEYFDYIGVDGIILFSTADNNPEYENYLRSLKKPLILIGNQMFDLPFIGIDDTKAMYDISKALSLRAPVGDMVYYAPALSYPHLHPTNAQLLRQKGFLQAMQALGRTYRVVTTLEDIGNFGGIVCSTDYYALQVLERLGYPKNVAIAGFDNLSLLKTLHTQILTVDYSTDSIAKQCIRYILGKPYKKSIEYTLLYTE